MKKFIAFWLLGIALVVLANAVAPYAVVLLAHIIFIIYLFVPEFDDDKYHEAVSTMKAFKQAFPGMANSPAFAEKQEYVDSVGMVGCGLHITNLFLSLSASVVFVIAVVLAIVDLWKGLG